MDVQHYEELAALQKYVSIMTGKKILLQFGGNTCTDGKSITLTPQTGPFNKRTQVMYFGGVNHECDHITEGSDINRFMYELNKEKHGNILQKLVNIVEDIRVEVAKDRKMPKIAIARAPYYEIKKELVIPTFKGITRASGLLPVLHVCGCMTIFNARMPQLGVSTKDIVIEPEIQAIYNKYFKKFEKRINALTDYQSAEKLARDMMKSLRDLIKDEIQEKKNPPPKQEPKDEPDNNDQENPDEPNKSESDAPGTDDNSEELDKPEDEETRDETSPSDNTDDESDGDPGKSGDADSDAPGDDENDGDKDPEGDGPKSDDAEDEVSDESSPGEEPEGDNPSGGNGDDEGGEQPGTDKSDDQSDEREPSSGSKDNEGGSDPEDSPESEDDDDAGQSGTDGGLGTGDKDDDSEDDSDRDSGSSPQEGDESEADEPIDSPDDKVEEDNTGEKDTDDAGDPLESKDPVNEDEIDKVIDKEIEPHADELISLDKLLTLISQVNFSNSDIYLKDPNVKDNIQDGYEGSDSEGQVYRTEGLKLVGQVGADICRMFIQQTKPRVVRRQYKGRFDLRRFEQTPYSDDLYTQRYPGALDKAALAIGLDNSSSMNSGNKATIASRLLSGLLFHADASSIPVEAAGYTINNTSCSGPLRTYPVRIDIIKRYEERYDAKIMRRCVPLPTYMKEYTPDMDVLTEFLMPRLMARPEKKKVVFMICDGQPSNICGRLQASYQRYLKSLKEAGIIIWGFGIEADLSTYFEDDWSYVSAQSLAPTLVSRLSKILLQERR